MRHQSAHVRNVAQMKRRKETSRKRRPTISDLRKKMRDTMGTTMDSIDNLFDENDAEEENEYQEYQSFDPLSTKDSNFFPSSSSNTPQQIIHRSSSSEQHHEQSYAPNICVSSIDIESKSSRSIISRGYQPKTLSQYRKYKKSLSSEPLGKLQPDLNRPELIQKRAKKERLRAFSDRLRQVNMSTLSERKKMRLDRNKTSQQEPREEVKQPSARERALEFAKTIPKPKPRHTYSRCSKNSLSSEDNDDTSSIVAPTPSRLDILRARHRELQEKVNFARNSIGL